MVLGSIFAAAGGLMDVFGTVDAVNGLMSIAERFPVVDEGDKGVARGTPPAGAEPSPFGGFKMPGVPYPTKFPDMETQRQAVDANLKKTLTGPAKVASDWIGQIGGRVTTIAIGASLTLLGIYFLLREAAPSAALPIVQGVADALEEKSK